VIDDAAAEQQKALDADAIKAAIAGNTADYDRIRGEQRALGRFRPWILGDCPTAVSAPWMA
jgi:Na+/melibiose symporter-like transporter